MHLRHRSARRAGGFALLVALVVSVAACGGNADDGEVDGSAASAQPGFTASATLDCVRSHELVLDLNTNRGTLSLDVLSDEFDEGDLGALLDEASGGGFTLEFDSGNSVVISFHRSAADAEAEVLTLRLLAKGAAQLAENRANATLAWRKAPSRAEVDLVKGCLSKGGGPIPVYEQDPSFAKSYRYTDEQRAAMTSALRDRGFEPSTVACFVKWAQQRYSIHALLLLPADEDPVRAALEHCRLR
jgi:hypothetical protein